MFARLAMGIVAKQLVMLEACLPTECVFGPLKYKTQIETEPKSPLNGDHDFPLLQKYTPIYIMLLLLLVGFTCVYIYMIYVYPKIQFPHSIKQ